MKANVKKCETAGLARSTKRGQSGKTIKLIGTFKKNVFNRTTDMKTVLKLWGFETFHLKRKLLFLKVWCYPK